MTDSDSDRESLSSAKDISEIARAYLDSLEHEIDKHKLDEIASKISDREERRERLVDEHGEDHYLIEKASETIEGLKQDRQELQDTAKSIEDFREELLQAVVEDPGFEFNEKWLEFEAVKALTHGLYGVQDASLAIQNRQIEQLGDISDLDEFDVIEMEHVIVSLVSDSLEGNETVQSKWDRLSDSVGYPGIKVLAKNGPMAPKDVASKLNEDTTKVKDRLKNFMRWDDFLPLYRPEKGIYGLSTTGKYLISNYAEMPFGDEIDSVGEENQEESQGDSLDSGTDEGSVQRTMGNTTQYDESEEPVASGSGNPEIEDGSSTEELDTVEKAEQMFADVTDSQGETDG
jgi:hypothetical protein